MSDVTVIGGIQGKIQVETFEQLMAAQQNSGVISVSYGGTGRNIAEALGRMGVDTALVAAAGNDLAGRSAKSDMAAAGVHTDYITLMDEQNTAMNVAILNIIGDLVFAVDNTDVYKCLTTELLQEAANQIQDSRFVCVDGSLTEDALRYVADTVKCPLFFDPHTEEDAAKAKEFIGAFHTIKPNRAEASVICGKEIFSEEQLMEAGQWFSDQGVERIFITLSGGGVYYKEGEKTGIIRPEKVLSFNDTQGAGDAFSAAVLDGSLKGMDIEDLAACGMKASASLLEGRTSIRR